MKLCLLLFAKPKVKDEDITGEITTISMMLETAERRKMRVEITYSSFLKHCSWIISFQSTGNPFRNLFTVSGEKPGKKKMNKEKCIISWKWQKAHDKFGIFLQKNLEIPSSKEWQKAAVTHMLSVSLKYIFQTLNNKEV